MKITAIRYQQGDRPLLTAVIPAGVLMDVTIVPRFGEYEFGYQRQPNKRHIEGIAKYLLSESVPPILPTAIILGVDAQELRSLIFDEQGAVVSLDLERCMGKSSPKFRVIDGQHRLLGIARALEMSLSEDQERNLRDYPLSVNILVREDVNALRFEIDAFVDINSKAKRIKTDLAILAKYQLELVGRQNRADFVEYICTRVAYLLNEDENPNNVWFNAITVDPTEPPGIVSISAWNKSLHKLANLILDQRYGTERRHFDIQECALSADIAKDLLAGVWRTVRARWPECFLDPVEGKPLFDEGYVLQKAIGVNAIHLQITRLYASHPDTVPKRFEECLAAVEAASDDWEVGGEFSAYNSEGGFRRLSAFLFDA